MNFIRYRESLNEIKKLAENYINLNKMDLARLQTLNEECIFAKGDLISSFTSLVGDLEDGLTLLIDRLEAIKKDLGRISGPDGTLEDILQLEDAWRNTLDLQKNIRSLVGPNRQEVRAEDVETGANGTIPPETTPAAIDKTGPADDLQELVVLAREEAAAGAEAAEAASKPVINSPPPAQVKVVKKDQHDNTPSGKKTVDHNGSPKKAQHNKKDQKHPPSHNTVKPLPVGKIYGEAEKKLMEEINKNIELIKSNKKK